MAALAPIVLFAYQRPSHTRQALDALAANAAAAKSELHIYCDGPKAADLPQVRRRIEETRAVAKAEARFRSVTVVERAANLGLARSIIEGVTEVLARNDRVIVLEDDIVSSAGFLEYMNAALETYAEDDQVGCIHAWNYHLDTSASPHPTFFLKGADCWGWGTWKRAWSLFRADGGALLDEIRARKLEREFDRRGTHPFTAMLEDQIAGKNDSWAIRWHASLFLAGRYCLHPTRPIVRNIGLDGSGMHCGISDLRQEPVDSILVERLPVEDAEWFFSAYRRTRGWLPRLKASSRRLLGRPI